MHAAILRKAYGQPPFGARNAEIGQTPLFLQAFLTVLIEAELMRKQPLLPAGKENDIELKPLRAVKGHEADAVAIARLLRVHHEADMLQKSAEAIELLHEPDQLFQVFEPRLRLRRLVLLPHPGIAGLVEDLLG